MFHQIADKFLAKHLESLKDGRFPIEILERGKDAEENEKLWKKITDKINEAGVSSRHRELYCAVKKF